MTFCCKTKNSTSWWPQKKKANSVELKSVSFIKLNGERIIINFKVFCLTLSESKNLLINETEGTLFYCFLCNMRHAVKPLSSSIHVNKAIRLIS